MFIKNFNLKKWIESYKIMSNRRIKRLERLLKEKKLICKIKRKPCIKCGCEIYYVFEYPEVNANGIYCSLCGTWQNFEHSQKYASINKKIRALNKQKQNLILNNNYSDYLKSDKWKQIRQIIAERDDYTCKICGKYTKTYFEIHHKNYKHIFHEEEDLSCLVCLCKECHQKITEKQHKSKINKK